MSKTAKNILRRAILVVLGLVLGVNVYVLNANTVAQNALPMPFGIGCAVVQSGSMEPTYHKGDLLFVKEQESYEVGDVVVYQSQNMLVVHRIIAKQGSMVTTQGDANNASDVPFSTSSIKGTVVGCIPGIGYVVDFMKTPIGIILLLTAALLLVELSFRKEKKRATTDEKTLYLEQIKAEIARLKQELDHPESVITNAPAGVMPGAPQNVIPSAPAGVIQSASEESQQRHPESAQYSPKRHPESAKQTKDLEAKDLNQAATISSANGFSMPSNTRSNRFKNIFNNELTKKHKHNDKEEENIETFSEWLESANQPSGQTMSQTGQASSGKAPGQVLSQASGSSVGYPVNPVSRANQIPSQVPSAQTGQVPGVVPQAPQTPSQVPPAQTWQVPSYSAGQVPSQVPSYPPSYPAGPTNPTNPPNPTNTTSPTNAINTSLTGFEDKKQQSTNGWTGW